jgi:hypothetical protein
MKRNMKRPLDLIMKNSHIENKLKDMKGSTLPKGGIYEVSFGYNTNFGGYTTLMSDIPKLSKIAGDRLKYR